jgi:metallophosphoesterase superfamily enzyme
MLGIRQSPGSEARGIETQEYAIRFGVISDTHVGATDYRAFGYPTHKRLEKVLDWYNTQDVKILVIAGDIVENSSQENWYIFSSSWDEHN